MEMASVTGSTVPETKVCEPGGSAHAARLRKPGDFVKFVPRGRPHRRFVACTEDLKEIRWAAKPHKLFRTSAKSAQARDLRGVTLGCESAVFLSSLSHVAEGAAGSCFSLVFQHRTLDLQAKSSEARDVWAAAFRWLISKTCDDAGVSAPFNVKHITHVNTNFEWDAANLNEEFELGRELGKGSFGSVFLARHRGSGLQLAVKKIDLKKNGEKPADIKSEVAVLRKCRHPGIVSFFGCAGPDRDNKLWICLELCPRGSLRDLLDAFGGLDEASVRFVTASVLKALLYLHSKRIVHRDLKAGNILLTAKGDCKLTDFGISMSLGGTMTLKRKRINTVAGSPLWMPPEVILGAGAVFRSDVWSLAITMIETAEGIPPLSDLRSPLHVMTSITRKPPPRLHNPSKWSPEFSAILASMLVKEVKTRPTPSQLILHAFVRGAIGDAGESPLLAALRNRLRARRAMKTLARRRKEQKSSREGSIDNPSDGGSSADNSSRHDSNDDDGGSVVFKPNADSTGAAGSMVAAKSSDAPSADSSATVVVRNDAAAATAARSRDRPSGTCCSCRGLCVIV